MKTLLGTALLICASVGLVSAKTKTAPAAATAKAPSVSQTVQQLERDWLDALKAGDVDKLGSILADDWTSLGPDGATMTKKDYLAAVKSGSSTVASYEMGPMAVKVVGGVAVVQGSDTQKSTDKGKDSSGKYAWMDVFAMHDGKWQAVRSQVALVK
jgi:ketosteroid isomerase-like protein